MAGLRLELPFGRIEIPADPMLLALTEEAMGSPWLKAQLADLIDANDCLVFYRGVLHLSDNAIECYYRWKEYALYGRALG